MGNHYANITLKGSRREDIADILRVNGCEAIISPSVDAITILYDKSIEIEENAIVVLGKKISEELGCVAWAIFIYDDDVFMYWLFEHGELIDEYNSSPEYFEGIISVPSGRDEKKLCQAFNAINKEREVHDILYCQKDIGVGSPPSGYVFETERHLHLCRVMGLPDYAVGTGYKYLIEGEIPEGLCLDDCLILEGGDH